MPIPARVKLIPYVEGDIFDIIDGFGPVTINGIQPAIPLDKVRLQFRDRTGAIGYTYSSDVLEDGNITITDAATWEGTFSPVQDFPLTEGCWLWDMEFYPLGYTKPYTIYQGKLKVLKQTTLPPV